MNVDFTNLIVFENDDYIVINKPPRLASLDERTPDRSQSILRLAKAYHADAQLGHRLDKETSGALAIAKNPDAYRHLAMQFEHREVAKRYHAVVNGVHDFENISVYLPIAQVRDGTAVRIDREKGKIAETIFNTLRAYKINTLVECMPITGRMHQIRVHLMCLKSSHRQRPHLRGGAGLSVAAQAEVQSEERYGGVAPDSTGGPARSFINVYNAQR